MIKPKNIRAYDVPPKTGINPDDPTRDYHLARLSRQPHLHRPLAQPRRFRRGGKKKLTKKRRPTKKINKKEKINKKKKT